MEPPHGQPLGQGRSQSGLTHNTVQHTDGGDTDLDRGQESRGVFTQLDGGGSAVVALINQLLQPRLARSHQRDFRHGKYAVEADESEQYCYFHMKGAERALCTKKLWIVRNSVRSLMTGTWQSAKDTRRSE